MNGELGTAAGRGDLVRLALHLIVEEALEGELSDALGRERYERGEEGKSGCPATVIGRAEVKNGERRAVDYSAPQVRDTPEPFVSSVRAALSGRTRELERLAVELYARGLSTRDIEDAFTDETGRRLFVAGGGERDHREAVGRVRRLLQARSLRARGRLPVHRRHRRAAASRASGEKRFWPPGGSARTDANRCWG